MTGRVKGKVCIVTGASAGIGLADAELLHREGANVVLTDVDRERGERAAAKLGEGAVFIHHDVASEEMWVNVIEKTLEAYGRINVLANNAGVLLPGTVLNTPLEEYRKTQAVNSEGVFLGCKHAIPIIEKSGGGSIINMSSVAALEGISQALAYSASKGAVRSMTKSIAIFCREQNNGIRCNSIHPDGVRTAMVGRFALGTDEVSDSDLENMESMTANPLMTPEDIANMVLFLASDESKYITGAELLIDNGATITPLR